MGRYFSGTLQAIFVVERSSETKIPLVDPLHSNEKSFHQAQEWQGQRFVRVVSFQKQNSFYGLDLGWSTGWIWVVLWNKHVSRKFQFAGMTRGSLWGWMTPFSGQKLFTRKCPHPNLMSNFHPRWAMKKTRGPLLSIKSWLFNRDPYDGLS